MLSASLPLPQDTPEARSPAFDCHLDAGLRALLSVFAFHPPGLTFSSKPLPSFWGLRTVHTLGIVDKLGLLITGALQL